jgi:hypothetical protein
MYSPGYFPEELGKITKDLNYNSPCSCRDNREPAYALLLAPYSSKVKAQKRLNLFLCKNIKE